jgi:hypothetical protein
MRDPGNAPSARFDRMPMPREAALRKNELGKQPAQYFVVKQKGEWKIRAGYRTTGFYANKGEALAAAIEFAEKDGMAGRDAEVLVQTEGQHFRTAWIYGRDPYPINIAPSP